MSDVLLGHDELDDAPPARPARTVQRELARQAVLTEILAALGRINSRFCGLLSQPPKRGAAMNDATLIAERLGQKREWATRLACEGADNSDECAAVVRQYVEFLEGCARTHVPNEASAYPAAVAKAGNDCLPLAQKLMSLVHISRAHPQDAAKRARSIARGAR